MAAGTGVVVVVFFHVVVVVVVFLLLVLLLLLLLSFLLLLSVVVSSPWQAGRQARSFFLLFPIIDKTETAQYRDTAPRRGVGKRSLSTTLFS